MVSSGRYGCGQGIAPDKPSHRIIDGSGKPATGVGLQLRPVLVDLYREDREDNGIDGVDDDWAVQVAATATASAALTSSGALYVWGTGVVLPPSGGVGDCRPNGSERGCTVLPLSGVQACDSVLPVQISLSHLWTTAGLGDRPPELRIVSVGASGERQLGIQVSYENITMH